MKCAFRQNVNHISMSIVLHSLGYEAHILNGLLCSCVGDALLNHKFFLLGMAAFAMAQSSYVTAFGFVPLVPEIGFPMYLAGVACELSCQLMTLLKSIKIELFILL